MGENSKIEWTTHTFNPWIGCQKVSAGCDHCYAEALMDTRYGKVQWGPHGERKRTAPANWKKPLQWAKAARDLPERPRVFCASLADVFDNQAPDGARADLFALIRQTPELDWLLLTKRPENIGEMLPLDWGNGYQNVWLGTTCEDQKAADRRIPLLLATPAHVRFLSCEPMIGPIDLWGARYKRPDGSIAGAKSWGTGPAIDWVICGGETGKGSRMMQSAWAASLRDDCSAAGIKFFMKQMTDKKPIPDDLLVRQFPEAA